MARKKKEIVEEKATVEAKSTVSDEISSEAQAVLDEQNRQTRVNECTNAIRQVLQANNCDLDVTVILKAGQVIPRIAITPIEVLQAQRAPQNQPV